MKRMCFLISILFLLTGFTYAKSTITVTNPNKSSNWRTGTAYAIRWDRVGIQHVKVKIRLYKSTGTTKIMNITDDTANDKSYQWTVPGSVNPGQYLIRVKTLDNLVWDDSAVFTITKNNITRLRGTWEAEEKPIPMYLKGPITVIKPSSASFWQEGTYHKIIWNNKFTKNKDTKIQLFNYNGKKFIQDIATVKLNNSGSTSEYLWKVPKIGPAKFMIRISTPQGSSGFSKMFTVQISTEVRTYKVHATTSNKRKWKKQTKGPGSWDGGLIEAFDPGPGRIRLGYANYFEDEAFGYHYRGEIYRSHVFFDLSQFKGVILKATLNYHYFHGFSGDNCGARIHKINKAFSSLFVIDADYLPNLNGLTSIVRGWVAHSSSNHGLLFTGNNEHFSHNNKKCVRFYDNVYLEIEILEKK